MPNNVPFHLHNIHGHHLSLLWRYHLLSDFDIHQIYIGYGDSLNVLAFQVGWVEVKVTVAVFRKTLPPF